MLAVLDAPCCAEHAGPTALCLYASDGAPIRRVELPASGGFPLVAAGARWIVVDPCRPSPILVRRADGSIRRASIDAAGRRVATACPRDGDELWVLAKASGLVLRRFRLPS
jgi:hypothetical protein